MKFLDQIEMYHKTFNDLVKLVESNYQSNQLREDPDIENYRTKIQHLLKDMKEKYKNYEKQKRHIYNNRFNSSEKGKLYRKECSIKYHYAHFDKEYYRKYRQKPERLAYQKEYNIKYLAYQKACAEFRAINI